MKNLKILIVDDEAELRNGVKSLLKNLLTDIDLHIAEAETGLQAIEQVKKETFNLVLMDVRMPQMSGLEALALIKEHDPRTFVVIMTAHSNLQDAVIAIKEGAYDYLEKPIQSAKLNEIIRKSLEAQSLVEELVLSQPVFDDDLDSDFVGRSEKMKEIFKLIYKLCKVDTTVLIRGENGTGKELVARAIHINSPRKTGPFVAINCGAIPENLVESEFFGHEKGAFTGAVERRIGQFQMANIGTLFLDEIAELRPEMQVKLLRVLQEKKFIPVGGTREVKTNARIIAATNRNLEKMIEDGRFREDLFYRLNVMPLFLPPLRERLDDLPFLVEHFIQKLKPHHPDSPIIGMTDEALTGLRKHRWPGNIRELENVIERAFILEAGSKISLNSLPDVVKAQSQPTVPAASIAVGGSTSGISSGHYGGSFDFELWKGEKEKEFIVEALKANSGKINQTVARANIPKNTLLRKMRKYGIQVKDLLAEE